MTPVRRNTTIRLDDALFDGMRTVWERDGIQPSEQIRRALRAWLAEKGVTTEKKTASRRVQPRRKA